jgi:hypothetical protein
MDIVHFDYVHLPIAINGSRYLLHLYDTYSAYHVVHPIANKPANIIQPIIVGFVQWSLNHGWQVRRLHSDDDTALKGLGTTLQHRGIEFTQSSAYNHNQNGFAERSGGVIIIVMRAIHINSQLPEALWPWVAISAAYILNRRPVQRLNWRTPITQILHMTTSLAPLRILGCKAYVLRKPIPRGDKLSSRVWIGYLVGIHATNMWHVWQPGSNRVRLVRDVQFDENSLYKDTLQDLPQLDVLNPEDETLLQSYEIQPVKMIQFPLILPYKSGPQPPPTLQPTWPTKEITPPPDGSHLQQPTPPDSPEPVNQIQATNLIATPPATPLSPLSILDSIPLLSAFLQAEGRHLKLDPLDLLLISPTIGVFHATRAQINQPLSPPKSWNSLAKHPHTKEFYTAMENELEMLNSRTTWETTNKSLLSPKQEILPLKWVYTYKTDATGTITKYKARLVVRGDLQKSYISREDLYAHTAAMKSFRTLIAITAAKGLILHQLDAIQAFLQSKLGPNEAFYVYPPPGSQTPNNMVYRLLRPLYGLRISPKAWFLDCTAKLRLIGAQPIPEEPCLWIYNSDIYIFFYVDDFLIAAKPSQIYTAKARLMEIFEMHDLGPASQFLGIQITTNDQSITISQDAYIDKLCEDYSVISPRKPPTTPILIPQQQLESYTGTASKDAILAMQRLAGSLLYLALNTRPEIARAVHLLAGHALNPSPAHLTAAKQIIQYAAYWRQYRPTYHQLPNQAISLEAATDASFADAPGRLSTEGYVIFLHGGPIAWACRRQATVATSTTEAELTALSHGVAELIALRRLLRQLGALPVSPVQVLCDNQQTVNIVNNDSPFVPTKLRHIDIQQHWLRSTLHGDGEHSAIKIKWIPTAEMPADGLTKLLPPPKHAEFVKMLKLIPIDDDVNSA